MPTVGGLVPMARSQKHTPGMMGALIQIIHTDDRVAEASAIHKVVKEDLACL